MHAWEAIRTTLDHLEKHINENYEIEDLALMAALSPFYYQRLFSRLVKKPVREYIKLRRLANACESLSNKENRILDVALEWGFSGHEVFTRAFKDAYGMTPEQYREHPVMLNHFNKPDLNLNYTMIDEGVPLISEGLVLEFNWRTLEHSIEFMGYSGHVSMDEQLPPGESTGTDLPGEIWRRFHQRKEEIPRLPAGRELGVAFMGDAPAGCFTYFAGAEVSNDAVNGEFQTWQLPAGKYVVCGFEAENFEDLATSALNKAIQYSGIWLEKHGLSTEPFAPELYYSSSPDTTYMELWHPVTDTP